SRHRVESILKTKEAVTGVAGSSLQNTKAKRGVSSKRVGIEEVTYEAETAIIVSGGIGADFEVIYENWPTRLGTVPNKMIAGVLDYVDGKMLAISEFAGARIVNRDRMWHYTEGIKNWNPIWNEHGIRILPGPSSLWFDAEGNRFDAPNFPG